VNAHQFAGLVESLIPIAGGVYVTLLAYRKVGKQEGEDARWDDWHDRYGSLMRIVGPLCVGFGLFLVAMALRS
jgi:hypothetical protein